MSNQMPKVGDEIVAMLPPPPTWWDRVLWRLFKIVRKKPFVEQRFVITATSEGKADD